MNEATAKQRAALWVAVVFLLGVSLGGVVGYIFAHRSVSANAPMTAAERRARGEPDAGPTPAVGGDLDPITRRI